jgi:excisionase family DNA binding protein
MTIDDVAAYLRLGRRSVYRLAVGREIPGRKVLGRWRFHLRDVEAWLRGREQVAP